LNQGQIVFAQVLENIPHYQFGKIVANYQGDKWVQSFTCWEHFICMSFAQLTYRRSLRDTVICLNAQGQKLYHMGLRHAVSKSTLSDANNNRDYRIYRDLAYYLIDIAKRLYAGDNHNLALGNSVFAFDSTTIDLCLSLFPWAKFRKTKSGIKIHALLDLQSSIPHFIDITPADVHDVNILDKLTLEKGTFIVFDRAYIDFARLYKLNQDGIFFITRAKSNMKSHRVYSHQVDKASGVLHDQTVKMTVYRTALDYPGKLRKIRFYDQENERELIFITNNFELPAQTIAQLYKFRWQVEIFFKWIKQHLRIKTFFGVSENAVKTHIWIAISAYVLVAILKKRLNLTASLYQILQVLSVTPFEKVPILQLFTEYNYSSYDNTIPKQLFLL
jgi:hypothetical protein